MILYLSSKYKINLLDFIQEEKNEVVKVLAGEISLSNFLIRDAGNFSHCKIIAVDYYATMDEHQEIIDALESFKMLYPTTRIILLAEELKKTDPFIKALIDNGIYNIIIKEDIEEIKKDIRLCVSSEGKTYQDCIKEFKLSNEVVLEYEFGQDVQIAFCGASQSAGTTTAAMNVANFLAARGATAAYIELGQNKLQLIKEHYEIPEVEGKTQWKGVDYYNQISAVSGNYNFKIYDIGVISQAKIDVLDEFDKTIICSRAKPYELIELNKIYNIFEEKELNFESYVNFASLVDREKITTLIPGVKFSNYSPDLFDGESNAELFFNILGKYIKEKII